MLRLSEQVEQVCFSGKGRLLTGAELTSYRIGGPLEEAYEPRSIEEAEKILQNLSSRLQAGEPLSILGMGSNTVVASAGIPGVTWVTRRLTEIEPIDGTDSHTYRFGAGVHLAKVAQFSQTQGLSGGEFFIGIPGSVGGAVRMNAGAMGQETAPLVKSVRLFNLETLSFEDWYPERLNFRYRHSDLDPQRHILISADLRFQPGDKAEIEALIQKNKRWRAEHHPTDPNGGSVFKNPPKETGLTVGKMLDDLGARQGWREGGVRISPMHANFIVNETRQGTSLDVLRLMVRMRRAIQKHYGVDVTPENLLMGRLSPLEQALWKELHGGERVDDPTLES
jgi:UDP-N-acetylmuramate dehydrogenase